MKVNSAKTIEINLILDENEATWLMNFIQNSHRTVEQDEDAKTRKRLFNLLKDELKGE